MVGTKPATTANRAPVDPWTGVHVATGALLGASRHSVPVVILTVAAFEVAEQLLETYLKRPESRANVAADVIATLGTFAIVRAARGAR